MDTQTISRPDAPAHCMDLLLDKQIVGGWRSFFLATRVCMRWHKFAFAFAAAVPFSIKAVAVSLYFAGAALGGAFPLKFEIDLVGMSRRHLHIWNLSHGSACPALEVRAMRRLGLSVRNPDSGVYHFVQKSCPQSLFAINDFLLLS